MRQTSPCRQSDLALFFRVDHRHISTPIRLPAPPFVLSAEQARRYGDAGREDGIAVERADVGCTVEVPVEAAHHSDEDAAVRAAQALGLAAALAIAQQVVRPPGFDAQCARVVGDEGRAVLAAEIAVAGARRVIGRLAGQRDLQAKGSAVASAGEGVFITSSPTDLAPKGPVGS